MFILTPEWNGLIMLITSNKTYQRFIEKVYLTLWCGAGVAWRSDIRSVMDCHTMVRDSIPSGNGVKTKLHVLRKG